MSAAFDAIGLYTVCTRSAVAPFDAVTVALMPNSAFAGSGAVPAGVGATVGVDVAVLVGCVAWPGFPEPARSCEDVWVGVGLEHPLRDARVRTAAAAISVAVRIVRCIAAPSDRRLSLKASER